MFWNVCVGNVFVCLKDICFDVQILIRVWLSVCGWILFDIGIGDYVVVVVKVDYFVKLGDFSFMVLVMKYVGFGD